MQISTFPSGRSFDIQNAVLAIGNFDGVHRGHQVLLAQAQEQARVLGRPWGVLTFEPHPRAVFQPDSPSFRITTPALKAERLQACGADFIAVQAFDWDFAGQSAEGFINNVLRRDLQAAHIVVGYDFKFGQFRRGTPDDILRAGLPVIIVQEVEDEGEGEGELSSSKIRQLLRQGAVEKANALLGWDWEISGTVVKGDQRGRALGYPTANFPLGDVVHPAYGVYAARVQLQGQERWYEAAINIGIRPMFEVKTAQVETHIFDFAQDIYGQTLKVRPVRHLRSEAKFNAIEDLIAQMDKDCAQARDLLKA